MKAMMKLILNAMLFAAMIVAVAEAQTIRKVPESFPTIQSGIVAAQSGDTVRVLPGVYAENINFLGKAITVISAGGPDVTTIDGSLTGTVVQINSGEGANSILDGFTIR